MDKLIETFCDVDDFCQLFIEQWQRTLIEQGDIKRRRACNLSPAEIMHYHSRFLALTSDIYLIPNF